MTSAAEVASAPQARARRKLVVPLVVAAVTLVGGAYYVSRRGLESTDDAQVDAEIVAVPALVSGVIAHIHFTENQHVEAGTLLAELDDAMAKATLAQEQAKLQAA